MCLEIGSIIFFCQLEGVCVLKKGYVFSCQLEGVIIIISLCTHTCQTLMIK